MEGRTLHCFLHQKMFFSTILWFKIRWTWVGGLEAGFRSPNSFQWILTFIECHIHDDPVLWARSFAAGGGTVRLIRAGDWCATAGTGTGGAGAAQQCGSRAGREAGAAQPRPHCQGHHSFLELLERHQTTPVR